MKIPSWVHTGAVLFAIFALWSDPALAQAGRKDDAQGVKRALLIGINKYKAPHVSKLQGSINDIETMRQILITRWGFSEQNIRMVKDEAATREGMLTAMDRLVKDTGEQDTVYFHFSGHGSQVEDQNGDEPDDRLDETLVPQDGRTGNVPDITDDELDAVFARLKAKQALIVLDSCHSGTATRSIDFQTRSIPRDTRINLYIPAKPSETGTRQIVPVLNSRYVVMTGAAANQEALDGPMEGRYYGLFTYALSRSLSASGINASPREIFSGIGQEFQRIQTRILRPSMPDPQLEAPPDLLEKPLLMFGAIPASADVTSRNARLAWIEVRSNQTGQVTLVNGLSLNAVVGSSWAIYPADETRFTPGHGLAVATVTAIRGNDAIANVQPATRPIPSGARAIAFMPAPPEKRIPVRLLDMPTDRRRHIEATIKRVLRDIVLVTGDTPARFLLDTQGDMVRLLAADGLQPITALPLRDDQWAAGIAVIISRFLKTSELLALDNQSSWLRVTARPQAPPRRVVNTPTAPGPAQYRIRQANQPRDKENSLQLMISVNSDAYLTIVDVDSEGGINVLFPNSYQRQDFYKDGFIRANKEVLIPDLLQDGNQAGFHWDYAPPAGTDTIKIFAHTDLQSAKLLREQLAALQTRNAGARGDSRTQEVASAFATVRGNLERGPLLVFDQTSHNPTRQAFAPTDQTSGTQSLPPETASHQMPAIPVVPTPNLDVTSTVDSHITSPDRALTAALVSDWATALVTVVISE